MADGTLTVITGKGRVLRGNRAAALAWPALLAGGSEAAVRALVAGMSAPPERVAADVNALVGALELAGALRR